MVMKCGLVTSSVALEDKSEASQSEVDKTSVKSKFVTISPPSLVVSEKVSEVSFTKSKVIKQINLTLFPTK